MQANPFSSTTTSVPDQLPASTNQPWAFAFTCAVAAALSTIVGNMLVYLQYPHHLTAILDNLPAWTANWIAHILLSFVIAAPLVRSYLERHRITLVRPKRILLGVGLGMVVADLLFSLLTSWFVVTIHPWLDELSFSRDWVFGTLGVISFGLTLLLPLWLGLHMGAKAPTSPEALLGNEVALLLGLSIATMGLLFLGSFAYELTQLRGRSYMIYAGPLLNGALVFACAKNTLPSSLAQLKPGKLALTGVLIFAVWLLVHLLLAALLVFAALISYEALLRPLPLSLAGVASLALLWPLTRLGLRWVYRAEAAA